MSYQLDYFDMYTSAGWKIIPLRPRSKSPFCKNWNKEWNRHRLRRIFEFHDNLNFGLLLGTIVDVEADTPDANYLLNDLIGDYPHPTYRSTRSGHHFFLNPDPDLTAATFYGIEFRGHLHQSVIPPSKHEDGSLYGWSALSKFPVPAMPASLLKFYLANRRKKPQFKAKLKVIPGHKRTKCFRCHRWVWIHRKRLFLESEVLRLHRLPWHCQNCRPFDLREPCRQHRRSLRK